MVTVAAIAQRILEENNYTLQDLSIIKLEYLIDNAIDYINLMAGTAIADLVGGSTGVADSGNTTTTVDTERIEADHYWNGYYIKYTSGNNIDQYQLVTHFDGATDTMTHAAFANAVAVGDIYVMGVSAGQLPHKSLVGTDNEIVVVKTLAALWLRAHIDRGPNINIGGLSVTSVLADPQYDLFTKIIEAGIERLKVASGTSGSNLAFVVGTDDADLEE